MRRSARARPVCQVPPVVKTTPIGSRFRPLETVSRPEGLGVAGELCPVWGLGLDRGCRGPWHPGTCTQDPGRRQEVSRRQEGGVGVEPGDWTTLLTSAVFAPANPPSNWLLGGGSTCGGTAAHLSGFTILLEEFP